MSTFIKSLGVTLFAASALFFNQANAAMNADLGVEDPSLFGIFCCCDWCGSCCDDDTCDSC